MIKEAIDTILGLREVEKIAGDDGRNYFSKNVTPDRPPLAATLEISTLVGIVDWFEFEGAGSNLGVVVDSPRSVSVVGLPDSTWLQRAKCIRAQAERSKFEFGRYMDLEMFNISLQCQFADSEEKTRVINFLASVTGDEIRTVEDDGIAQEVVVRTKTTMKERATMSPIVNLAPYRTFHDVEQPTSAFLLRLQKVEGNLPVVALFEADGGRWKHEAIQSIHEFLDRELPDEIQVIR